MTTERDALLRILALSRSWLRWQWPFAKEVAHVAEQGLGIGAAADEDNECTYPQCGCHAGHELCGVVDDISAYGCTASGVGSKSNGPTTGEQQPHDDYAAGLQRERGQGGGNHARTVFSAGRVGGKMQFVMRGPFAQSGDAPAVGCGWSTCSCVWPCSIMMAALERQR